MENPYIARVNKLVFALSVRIEFHSTTDFRHLEERSLWGASVDEFLPLTENDLVHIEWAPADESLALEDSLNATMHKVKRLIPREGSPHIKRTLRWNKDYDATKDMILGTVRHVDLNVVDGEIKTISPPILPKNFKVDADALWDFVGLSIGDDIFFTAHGGYINALALAEFGTEWENNKDIWRRKDVMRRTFPDHS